MSLWQDAIIVSEYTQGQAVEDGVIVSISGQAELKELCDNAGFKCPVAMTSHLWNTVEDGLKEPGQDLKGRLWDILWMATTAFKNFQEDKYLVPFEVLMRGSDHKLHKLKLWLTFSEAEGFCIMYPEDY